MPWISRRDLDRLYALIERLSDHRSRVERVEAGLSETPAPPKQLLGPMPEAVRTWIDSHEDGVRGQLRKEANRAARDSGSWDAVVRRINKETRE